MTLIDRLKVYYNRCDPYESLQPDDARNVPFDEPSASGEQVRGSDWVGLLATSFLFATKPVKRYFSGLPGSGKSTELRRLARRLAPKMFVVQVDILEFVDPTSPLEAADLLIPMLYATQRERLRAKGTPDDQIAAALRGSPFDRFVSFLTQTHVFIQRGQVAVPGGAATFALELKGQTNVRARVREYVLDAPVTFREKIAEAFNELLTEVRTEGLEQIVVVVDSLEKVEGTTENWQQVLLSFERLFANGAGVLELPVHALYTLPPALVFRSNVGTIDFMPMIKLRDRRGHPNAHGVSLACDLVYKRIDVADLKLILGEAKVDARLGRLISWSGGYPREIVRVLADLIRVAVSAWDPSKPESALALSDARFDAFLRQHTDAIRNVINKEDLPLLRAIHETHDKLPENDAERVILERLFRVNVVLRYRNDDQWFDVHPAIESML